MKLENPTSRRMCYLPDHPLAGKNGYVSEHRVVLYEKIGAGPHPCHWCGTEVHWTKAVQGTGHKGMLVGDHINGDPLDNRPDNLVPSCQGCNVGRVRRLPDDVLAVTQSNGTRRRAVERSCEQCGATFLTSLDQVRVGKGRFCSMSCARKTPRAQMYGPPKPRKQYRTVVNRQCEQCRADFAARSDAVARGRGRFCSVACANRHRKASGATD